MNPHGVCSGGLAEKAILPEEMCEDDGLLVSHLQYDRPNATRTRAIVYTGQSAASAEFRFGSNNL